MNNHVVTIGEIMFRNIFLLLCLMYVSVNACYQGSCTGDCENKNVSLCTETQCNDCNKYEQCIQGTSATIVYWDGAMCKHPFD